MLEMRRDIFCSHMEEDKDEIIEHEFKLFEDIAAQPVALVKAAAESTTRFVQKYSGFSLYKRFIYCYS